MLIDDPFHLVTRNYYYLAVPTKHSVYYGDNRDTVSKNTIVAGNGLFKILIKPDECKNEFSSCIFEISHLSTFYARNLISGCCKVTKNIG